jgi:hypothetical protein
VETRRPLLPTNCQQQSPRGESSPGPTRWSPPSPTCGAAAAPLTSTHQRRQVGGTPWGIDHAQHRPQRDPKRAATATTSPTATAARQQACPTGTTHYHPARAASRRAEVTGAGSFGVQTCTGGWLAPPVSRAADGGRELHINSRHHTVGSSQVVRRVNYRVLARQRLGRTPVPRSGASQSDQSRSGQGAQW